MKGSFKSIFILPFILITLTSFAQQELSVWYFGNGAGIDFSGTSPIALTNGAMNSSEGCSSIADADGNLLFYTDGRVVWDANHNLMPNANGNTWDKTLSGNSSSTQSAIIAPVINQPGKYYIFSVDGLTTSEFLTEGPLGLWDGLYYTIIDMKMNACKGDVDTASIRSIAGFSGSAQNKIQLVDSTAEKLCIIAHENGIDYWVVTRLSLSSVYYAFLVTESGVNSNAVITPIGSVGYSDPFGTGTNQSHGVGSLVNSLDGRLIIDAELNDSLELFDFNKQTGMLSNRQGLTNYVNMFYGAAFSSNDSILYVSAFSTPFDGSKDSIYQFNRYSSDVAGSKKSFALSTSLRLGALRLAPDGKIYGAMTNTSSLTVINSPNNIANPDILESSFSLNSKQSKIGLPTMYNGNLNLFSSAPFSLKDADICVGDNVSLSTSDGSSGFTYSWTPTLGLSDSTILNPVASPTASTTYSLIATDACGKIYKGLVTVDVSVMPVASFNASKNSGQPPLEVAFTNTSTPSTGVSYQWDFGDTSSSMEESPIHIFNSKGKYKVTLIAKTSEACADTAIYEFIDVFEKSQLSAPNIFTPNGDYVNEKFVVDAIGITELDARIYNRWGKKVYEWSGVTGGWDGKTLTGHEAPEGTYFYVLIGLGNDNLNYRESGSILLKR